MAAVAAGSGGAPAPAAAAPTTAMALRPEVEALMEEMVANRHWFHAHPELAFEEVLTAAKIAELLRSYGVETVLEGCGRTGVVALIPGGAGPGPCILLRADMDALPLTETADVPYKSQHPGKMHACGHDGHCAQLLAAVKVLWAKRGSLRGSIKALFQPAEEGHGGAKATIEDGLLEEGKWGPRVDACYGIHLWSYDPLGTIGLSHGPVMAASDKWEITVRGKGGHGAAPHGTVDAIVAASQVVTSLQTIVSRNVAPLDSAVITVGMFHAGSGYNIICDEAKLTGTVRTFSPSTQDLVEARMRTCCSCVAAAHGATAELDLI